MTIGLTITGFEQTQEEMLRVEKRVLVATDNSIFKTGLLVQAEAQLKTPVDLGNLKASAFTIGKNLQIAGGSFTGDDAGQLASDSTDAINNQKGKVLSRELQNKKTVVVGFSANYAWWVHEIPARHEVGDWKFLERSMLENGGTLLSNLSSDIGKVL